LALIATMFVVAVASVLIAQERAAAPRENLSAPGAAPPKGPPLPPPRSPSGRVSLAGTPDGKGIWMPIIPFGSPLAPPNETPLMPWSRKLYEERRAALLEPHSRCKASGGVRELQTPYGVEIVELPELQRVYLFDIGGPHTVRIIYTDGRKHPATLTPGAYGHSIGWWESNDTLVIDTVGYNEAFWVDRQGLPGSTQLHTTERLTRKVLDTIDYEITIDDPEVYTRPFTGRFELRLDPRIELYEYVCQEANYAEELMIRGERPVSFTPDIVP